MRRDAEAHALREVLLDALERRLEALAGAVGFAPEDLQVDERAQARRRARARRGAAEARVADGRDPGGEALDGAELRERGEVVGLEPPLALDVEPQPRSELESVAEAGVRRVLEVRVRVHEARHD